jgi:hypothetical protein
MFRRVTEASCTLLNLAAREQSFRLLSPLEPYPCGIASPREGKMLLYVFVRRVFAGACLALCALPAAADNALLLEIDRAKIIELPAGTNTLVIGNPGVADATVLRRQNRIVLTARAYGQTNMIALDARGEALAEVMLIVRNSEQALVVQRGLERESWSCNPRCERAVNPGDAARHTGEATGQAGAYGAFARPQAAGGK